MIKKIPGVHTEKGLTFIELIIVLSIFGIMASIVLFRFDDFTARVRINNLAQDIALRVVGAQKAAIAGAANASVTAGTRPTYGVFFESATTPGPDNTQFTYFNDLGAPSNNKEYDAPASGCTNECISVTTITTGEYVSDICYRLVSGSQSCGNSTAVSVTFTRPFSDATIRIHNLTGPSVIPLARDVYIEISTQGDTPLKRTIAVNTLGKIWVYEGPASVYGVI